MEEVKEYKNIKLKVAFWLLFVIFLGVYFFEFVLVKIPDGYIGILNRAGKISKVYSSGTYIKIPFIDKLDVRWGNVRRFEGTVKCLTKEHIEVELDYWFLYRPNSFDSLMHLERNYGDDDYIEEVLIRPMVYQTFRTKIANTKLKDIVPKASEIIDSIQEELNEITKKAYIYESNDGGKTFDVTGFLDVSDVDITHAPKFEYGDYITLELYTLEEKGDYKKAVGFECLVLFLQSDITYLYYPQELDEALRKQQVTP